MKRLLFVPALILAGAACAPQPRPTAPPPAPAPAGTPTPTSLLSRVDPSVVEETDSYVIRRYPKSRFAKVGDRLIKDPLVAKPVEYFKEDGEYYYVSFPKAVPGQAELQRQLQPTPAPGAVPVPDRQTLAGRPTSASVTAEDFRDLFPPSAAGRARFSKVAQPGLPPDGMWRASFVIADANGDGRPDIVSPPSRLSGSGDLKIWLGDGKGAFSPWTLSFSEGGKPVPNFSIVYGGVSVGDIDGDGQMDVVSGSHGAGVVSLFGDGKGGFEVVRTGLPVRNFSSQAVALLDANGDGKLDLVASRDVVDSKASEAVDRMQVRIYLFVSREKGWEFKKDGLVGGLYSNSLAAWDYDGDGRQDVLTGSHYTGGLTLLWKSAGDGTFSPVAIEPIELYAYHFSSAPGTFGKERAPAFADSYFAQANVPDSARAGGVSIYAFENGAWRRHRVWRKANWQAYGYALAMGDLDGDGLDDVVMPDNEARKLRFFFQLPDGGFVEAADSEEPALDSPGQAVRLSDLDGDGRLDVVLSKTKPSGDPQAPGGWEVWLNRP